MTVLIIIWAVFAYIAIAIGFFILMRKIDAFSAGDVSDDVPICIFWPITLPISLLIAAASGVEKLFEAIDKNINERKRRHERTLHDTES